MRVLRVEGGEVACQNARNRTPDSCRFCVHSRRFLVRGEWVTSPARAYCMLKRAVTHVDSADVTAVECDDDGTEGFRSIMTVIS
ncbi:hypothetical protein CUJ86_05975 [Methanofollis fontis]|uniref:Uncharacterized protein n=1 Tax=Methanofollis fontis TaxID=2052832 RepID=A0A483CQS2_9EURY|nr:hypothetical protein CUJ86_05975 [Methanofollis fontis]